MIKKGGVEVFTVNRFAMVLEPTQAYMEWAKKCLCSESELTLDELREDSTVYLIPETDDEEAWLEQNYKAIFQHELGAWCTDVKFWPPAQSFETFETFFKVSFHSMVIDMGEEPLEIDEE